jgi:hypothetical protein
MDHDRLKSRLTRSKLVLGDVKETVPGFLERLSSASASVRGSAGRARARYWSRLDYSSAANFDRSADAYRKDWAQYLGVPNPGAAPLNIKRVKVREFDGYTAWRVWFDTVPGVQAYGILLVPKAAGPKAALICVHGHQGTPEIVADVCGAVPAVC